MPRLQLDQLNRSLWGGTFLNISHLKISLADSNVHPKLRTNDLGRSEKRLRRSAYVFQASVDEFQHARVGEGGSTRHCSGMGKTWQTGSSRVARDLGLRCRISSLHPVCLKKDGGFQQIQNLTSSLSHCGAFILQNLEECVKQNVKS